MPFKIIKYGDDRLRQSSKSITKNDQPAELIQMLFETLTQQGGIGLAAPQVGINQSVFVIDTTLQTNTDDACKPFKAAYINPEITWFSDKSCRFNEGCLSVPTIYKDIERPSSIRVSYLDSTFNKVEETLHGIKARIFQHEYDHLEGVLFIDHLHPIRKLFICHKLLYFRGKFLHSQKKS